MTSLQERPTPVLSPLYCKGCGRCIESCAHHCIQAGTAVHPTTGLVPVTLHLENCTGCRLCVEACPEPNGLSMATPEVGLGPVGATALNDLRRGTDLARDLEDARVPFPPSRPMILKGTHASAVGALLAGCRHFYGYPITPSTEGAEFMAKLLPALDGVFLQAVSEVATINYMYGTAGAGFRTMTFTSSPGFSLMLEGLSYMIGAELPAVVVNVMRAGPGLGNIAPEQADIKLACRGLGHGNTHAIVLAPSTTQEMLDHTTLAFELAFRYRNPVIVLADGYLGQMTGKVTLPDTMLKPGLPAWAVYGDRDHRQNLICSIRLDEHDSENFNIELNRKYRRIQEREQRADVFEADDCEVLLVACNTPARMAKGAARVLRAHGIRAGLFRPQTLWPFPIAAFASAIARAERIAVVEASNGQLEDELRLAASHEGLRLPPVQHVRRFGGILPSVEDIVEQVTNPSAERDVRG